MTIENVAIRIYSTFARAFPSQFEQICGPEMIHTAEDLLRDEARSGRGWRVLLLLPGLLFDLAVRLVAEHCKDAARDARYAVRTLARSPGFTVAAALCLSIGIGVTAGMYSQVQSTIFRHIPGVKDADALVRLQKPVSFANYQEIENRAGLFSSVAAFLAPVPLVITNQGQRSERVWGHLTTPNYFDVLGPGVALGRLFGAEEAKQGAGQVAVLSHRLWQTRFGGDRSILGRTLQINGQVVTVIGVAEPGFLGASPSTAVAELWIPTTASPHTAPELSDLADRRAANFNVIGRLAPNVTPAQAEEGLEALVRRLEQVYNDVDKDSKEKRVLLLPGGRMFPVRDQDLPKAIGFPLLLVTLVLMMACGNVANMMLARGLARRQEMALRLSLGAGPGRILRQLLTESLMVSALGGLGGMLFVFWFSSLTRSFQPMMPGYVHFESNFQWGSLGIAALLAAACAFASGVAPALRATRVDVYAGLRTRGLSNGSSRRWFNLRNLLVFQQVAISMVLLLLTGFIVVGWRRAANVEVGFDPRNLYAVNLDPLRDGYTPEQTRDLFRRLSTQLSNTSGIQSVSVAQTLPLAMSSGEMMINAKVEFAGAARSFGAMRADRVGEGFFSTIGAGLLSGREFTQRDEQDGSRVVIVNDTMARRVWPNEQAVGQVIDLEGSKWEVVGVVSDVRSAFPLAPRMPAVYRPVTAEGFASPSMHGVTAVVRVAPGLDAPVRLRQAIELIDPNVTVFHVKPVSEEIRQMLYLTDFATYVYGGMGVFGLILASIGLAGVTAYSVARRIHEIGIRMALGATRIKVLALVLREGSVIILAGTIVGVAIALAAARALASFVDTLGRTTSTSIADPVLLVGGPTLLALIALAACYVPAHRSTRIDPAMALRAD